MTGQFWLDQLDVQRTGVYQDGRFERRVATSMTAKGQMLLDSGTQIRVEIALTPSEREELMALMGRLGERVRQELTERFYGEPDSEPS